MSERILFLCQYYYPEYVSSAMLPTQLAEELSKKDLKVDVICGYPQEYYSGEKLAKKEVYNKVTISRVKYGSHDNKKKLGRVYNFFSFFISVLKKFNEIKKYNIVLVYSNPPILPLISYWAFKVTGTKFIFVGFDLYPDNALALNAIKKNGFIEKLMMYINKRVYSTAEGIVAISEDMKNYMLNKYPYLLEEKVEVIPNWYTGEVTHSSNPIVNKEFKDLGNSWGLIVLYTGNMGEAQDLDTIIDSIIEMKERNLHKNILFIFTGHGSKTKEIKQKLVKEEINNVKFYGFLKGQDYADMLSISDICLVSLKKGIEGLGVPSKTYGYFAFGKPVIAIMSSQTELGININNYEAGACISQGETEKFIELLVRYRDNPTLLKNAQKGSAKLHNNKYEKKISINKYYNLIKKF